MYSFMKEGNDEIGSPRISLNLRCFLTVRQRFVGVGSTQGKKNEMKSKSLLGRSAVSHYLLLFRMAHKRLV